MQQVDAWSAWDTLEGRRDRAFRGELRKATASGFVHARRADIFDTLLDGKIAIIEAVEEDFEDNIHFAVVIEDDPGRDLGEMRQIGHRFFFAPRKLRPLRNERPAQC